MGGFVKIDGDIFGSSIMEEKPVTRLVWFFFLAAADRHGRVDQTHQSLARLYNLSLTDVEEAIRDLEQPDEISRSPAEDGRRIVRIDENRTWGWQIVNYELYRNARNAEERRAYKTAHQAAKRSKDALEGDCPQLSTAVHTSPLVDNVDRSGPMQKQSAEAECRSRKERRAPTELVDDEELVDDGVTIIPTTREAERLESIQIDRRGQQAELEWRVKRVWADHVGMRELHWKDHEHRDQAPGRPPTLTPVRRKAIVAALKRHDRDILGPDSRDEWVANSRPRAAGVGIFFDPWMTADKEGNQAGQKGTRYLSPDYCWKVCKGGTDNVDRFADIYFVRKARKK